MEKEGGACNNQHSDLGRPSPSLQRPGNPSQQLCSAAEPSQSEQGTWQEFYQLWRLICPLPPPRHGNPVMLKPGGGQAELIAPEQSQYQAWRVPLICPDRGSSFTAPLLLSVALGPFQPESLFRKFGRCLKWTLLPDPGMGADHRPTSC